MRLHVSMHMRSRYDIKSYEGREGRLATRGLLELLPWITKVVKENTSGLGLGLEVGGTPKNATGIVQVENRRRTVTYKN